MEKDCEKERELETGSLISGLHGASTVSQQDTLIHEPTIRDDEEQASQVGSLNQDEQPSQLTSGYLQELEIHKAGLKAELSKLRDEQKSLEQNKWKASKVDQPKVDRKLSEVKSKIQRLQRDLEKTTNAALVESETGEFDERLHARETGEMDGTEQLQSTTVEQPQIKPTGNALLFLEVDGVVSSLAGGLQDELLRVVKQVLEQSRAQLVLTSNWRRDPRLVRMLEGTMRRMDMDCITLITPHLARQSSSNASESSKEQQRVDEIRAFLKQSKSSLPWLVLDTLALGKDENPDLSDPLTPLHFLRIRSPTGISAKDAKAVLNLLRMQCVEMARTWNLELAQNQMRGIELAFAMGTHHRLGQASQVDLLRRRVHELVRDAQTRRGGSDIIRNLLRRRVTVPSEQFPTLGAAFADADVVPCVTLHVTLLRGRYVISEPLRTRGRVVVQAEAGAGLSEVELVGYGLQPILAVEDAEFVSEPLLRDPRHAQGYVRLENITLRQAAMDEAEFVAERLAAMTAENQHKETRGLYRRKLLDARLYSNGEAADKACPSIEAAKQRLAQHALQQAKALHSKKASEMPTHPTMSPFLCHAFEGCVSMQGCELSSEVGGVVHAARTGAVVMERCKITGSRHCGVVGGQGGVIELADCRVEGCGLMGVVAAGGSKVTARGSTLSGNGVSGAGGAGGGLMRVEGCRLEGNAQAGASAEGAETVVVVLECAVEENKGYGVAVQGGALAEVEGGSVRGNGGSGVSCGLAQSRAALRRTVVEGNKGSAVQAVQGGMVVVEEAELKGNGAVGVLVVDGAKAVVSGSRVEENGGHGAAAEQGATLTLRGCGVEANKGAGVVGVHGGTRVAVDGGRVAANRVGAFALQGATIALGREAVVEGNREGEEREESGGRVLRAAAASQETLAVPEPPDAAGRKGR